jgi:hypothetical protein
MSAGSADIDYCDEKFHGNSPYPGGNWSNEKLNNWRR